MIDVPGRVFEAYPTIARPRTTPVPLGNAGGLSGAALWTFASSMGPLVVRAWPVDGPSAADLARVRNWLGVLGPLGFVPVPLATTDGAASVEAVGRLWEVAPWRPGRPDLSRPMALARLRAAFEGLAKVHRALGHLGSTGPSPGLIARRQEVACLLDGELSRMETAVSLSPRDARRAIADRWLAAARIGLPALATRLVPGSGAVVRLQPVVRDARAEHFLFDGDALTGLVDFGAIGIDSPAIDLARLLGESTAGDTGSRRAALEAYESILPMTPSPLALVETIEAANAWLGPARWVRWHFLDGRRFDDPKAVSVGLERTWTRLVESGVIG